MWRCPYCETRNESEASVCAVCRMARGSAPPPVSTPPGHPTKRDAPLVSTPSNHPRERLPLAATPPGRPEKAAPPTVPPPDPPRGKAAPRRNGKAAKVVLWLFLIAALIAIYAFFINGRDGSVLPSLSSLPQREPTAVEQSSDALAALPAANSEQPVNQPSIKASEPYEMDKPILLDKVYRSGDAGIDVLWAQTQLRALGYFNKKGYDITGYMGTRTVSELKRFQKKCALENRSGTLDQETVDALTDMAMVNDAWTPVYIGGFYEQIPDIPAEGLSSGSSGAAVLWVQRRLQALGYDVGDVDGAYGKQTTKAVKAFQKDHGYQQTGLVKLGILREIARVYNE